MSIIEKGRLVVWNMKKKTAAKNILNALVKKVVLLFVTA
jgi:hypothetical protein